MKIKIIPELVFACVSEAMRPIQKALENLWTGVRIFDEESLINEISAFKNFKEFLVYRIGNVCLDSVIDRLSIESDHLKACQIASIALRQALDNRLVVVTDREIEFAINLMIENEKLSLE